MRKSSKKIWRLAPLLSMCLFSGVYAQTPFGIAVGGGDSVSGAGPVAYFVSPTGELTALSPLPGPNTLFKCVSMNAFQSGLIGGQDLVSLNPLLYRFSSEGLLTPLSPLPTNASIERIVVNDSGYGLATGLSGGAATYLAQVSPGGVVNDISSAITSDGTNPRIALNSLDQGIFGGSNAGQLYAALISPSGTATPLVLPAGGSFINEVFGVAINDSGIGLVGAQFDPPSTSLAYLVSPSGDLTAVTGIQAPDGANFVYNVALNNANQGIITINSTVPALQIYSLSSDGTASLAASLDASLNMNSLFAVAINSSGNGIVSGSFVSPSPGYVFLVSSTGSVTNVPLNCNDSGEIISVAIAPSGAALAGGQCFNGSMVKPLLYLISPGGDVTSISLPYANFNATVFGVSIGFLSHVPTTGLSGNNLHFADYINTFASDKAFYFLPAILDGTLQDALMSAAPTRNAISLSVAGNNLFAMNQALSSRSYNSRIGATHSPSTDFAYAKRGHNRSVHLVASADDSIAAAPYTPMETEPSSFCPNYEIWGTVLGAVAFQKSQDQTPGFQPTNGSVVLGFDGYLSSQACLGFGAAYGYSHIHQYKGAGDGHVNQEYLFLHGLWFNDRAYVDAALWGGASQTSNLRKIRMTGFHFTAKSNPKAWQLAPHLEVGGNFRPGNTLTIEPFASVDWINNWQQSYSESGSGPFNIHQKAQYSSFLRSEAGLRFFERIEFSSWNLFLLETGAYVNKTAFSLGRVNGFILGSSGSFTVETFTGTQNLGLAGFEMFFRSKTPTRPYGSINYQGEFGTKYQSHVVSLNLYYQF